jgi:hypothetical protein
MTEAVAEVDEAGRSSGRPMACALAPLEARGLRRASWPRLVCRLAFDMAALAPALALALGLALALALALALDPTLSLTLTIPT